MLRGWEPELGTAVRDTPGRLAMRSADGDVDLMLAASLELPPRRLAAPLPLPEQLLTGSSEKPEVAPPVLV